MVVYPFQEPDDTFVSGLWQNRYRSRTEFDVSVGDGAIVGSDDITSHHALRPI